MTHFYQTLGHHSVVKRYRILNDCLVLIQRTSISRVDKIRIEAKIIRLQSLLLSSATTVSVGERPGEEDPFDVLLGELRQVPPKVSGDHSALQSFKQRLRSLLSRLDCDQLSH